MIKPLVIMKQIIFSNWNFMRLFRLIIGLGIMIQGIYIKDILFGIAGFIFAGMALFNLGCCAVGGCAVAPKKNTENTKDIHYEEVV